MIDGPNLIQSKLTQIKRLVRQRNLSGAMAALEKLKEKQTISPYDEAIILQKMGFFEAASKLYRQIRDWDTMEKLLFAVIVCSLKSTPPMTLYARECAKKLAFGSVVKIKAQIMILSKENNLAGIQEYLQTIDWVNDISVLRALGRAYEEHEHFEHALQYYQMGQTLSPDFFVLRRSGHCLEVLQQFDKAIEQYKLAIRLYPSKGAILLERMAHCKTENQKLKQQRKDILLCVHQEMLMGNFEAAITKLLSIPNGSNNKLVRLNLATAHYALGHYEIAAHLYLEVLQAFPIEQSTLQSLRNCFMVMGDFEAEQEYRSSPQFDPRIYQEKFGHISLISRLLEPYDILHTITELANNPINVHPCAFAGLMQSVANWQQCPQEVLKDFKQYATHLLSNEPRIVQIIGLLKDYGLAGRFEAILGRLDPFSKSELSLLSYLPNYGAIRGNLSAYIAPPSDQPDVQAATVALSRLDLRPQNM